MFDELLADVEGSSRTNGEVTEMLEEQLGIQVTGKVADGSSLSCLLRVAEEVSETYLWVQL